MVIRLLIRGGAWLLLLGSWGALHAQSMPRTVVGSAGTYYTNLLFGNLHFTVGEVAVARYTADAALDEGFHRMYFDLVVDTKDVTPAEWAVSVFPNPTADRLRVALPSHLTRTIAQLYSSTGQVVLQVPDLSPDAELDVSHLPAGTYWLRLHDLAGQQTATFQVQKIQR